MSKGAGLFLILAGVGAAAYALPPGILPGTGTSAEQRLADVVQIATNGTSVTNPAIEPPGRTQRFATPQLTSSRDGTSRVVAGARPAQVNQAVVVAEAPTAVGRDASTIAPAGRITIVPATRPNATAPPIITPPAPVAVRRNTTGGSASTEGQAVLARDIQRELKRVGCLEGDITSDWGPAAQKAMKAFTDRVNATLPTDRPDHILLTLVRGQSATTCGKACPAGQSFGAEGRCLPTAVIAQAAKRPLSRTANAAPAAVPSNDPAAPRTSRTTGTASPAERAETKAWVTVVKPTNQAPAATAALVEAPRPVERRTSPAPIFSSAPAVMAPRIAEAAPTIVPPAPEPASRQADQRSERERRIEGRMALAGPAQAGANQGVEPAAPTLNVPRVALPLPGALSGAAAPSGYAPARTKTAAVEPDTAKAPTLPSPPITGNSDGVERDQQGARRPRPPGQEDRASARRSAPSLPAAVRAPAPQQQRAQPRYDAPRPRFTTSIFSRLSRDGI